MGRCYEFATVITEGCDHAMRVAADGGACECPTCGARCEGQFAACEAILQKPGYVPSNAPDWAVLGLEAPHPKRATPRSRSHGEKHSSAAGGDADDVMALVRSELAATADGLKAEVALVENFIELAQSRLGDTITARTLQAVRPVIEQHCAELRDEIAVLRRELTDRTAALSSAQDRMETLLDEHDARFERSLGVTPPQ